jgi:hypothetical protein
VTEAAQVSKSSLEDNKGYMGCYVGSALSATEQLYNLAKGSGA